MPEMFNMMYDEIFLKDNKVNPLDYEMINDITKKFVDSNASIAEKREFLILKREYLKVVNIKDYRETQKQLYQNKTRNEIITFELARIRNKGDVNPEVMEQISNVERMLSLRDEDISDDLYMKIINGIIKLEISLGMRVGLFNELCCLFEEELKNVESKLSYVMKR